MLNRKQRRLRQETAHIKPLLLLTTFSNISCISVQPTTAKAKWKEYEIGKCEAY